MFHAGIADDEDCLGRKFFSMFRGFCVFCPLNIVRGIAGIAQTSDELVEQIEIIKERPACFHIGILAAQRASVINDRKNDVIGESVAVGVDIGGCRITKKKNKKK